MSADVYDVPFLIRGRVVHPTEGDSVEYAGRVGATFRTPDPRRWASQLTLADADQLRDLEEMPVAEIIDFLAALGPRLALDTNPWMQTAFEMALAAGELTESVLRPVYAQTVEMFSRERLAGTVERSVGTAFLDGWVELGRAGMSTLRMRAVGTRNMHIIAGNVPITAGMTVTRTALVKGDCLIKMPSNDPFTAVAIGMSMIELDPTHPVTKHYATAYWKGGDETVEREIYRPSRIEKLTAWGGMSSMTHINKYLVPGIELIAMNPKYSMSLVGHEALENAEAMEEAAIGVAYMAGRMNQTACSSTRVVYVECGTDDADLERLEQFGRAVHGAFLVMPPHESTNPKRPDHELDAELEALALDDDWYRVIGNTSTAGVVVSRTDEPVEFADRLNNRVVNLVPLADLTRVLRWVDESTQTVGIYPERLREQLRDRLARHGVQRIVPLGTSITKPTGDPEQYLGIPHDGTEPMRRMVRWVLDQSVEPV